MKLRFLICLVSCTLAFGLKAQPINIGLFCANPKSTLSFVPQNCHYMLIKDSLCYDTLKIGTLYSVQLGKDSTVKLLSSYQQFGAYKELTLVALDSTGELKFKAQAKNGKDKFFTGDFKFKMYKGNLCVMNYLDIERYIEAVIESESGLGHTLEYYKVQAVISRTYARSNAFKHVKEEGFNLCDNTHCQAYKHKGKSNPVIKQAVIDTKGIVMVDDSLNLITAAFHSNCGGQTCNSEMVWSKPLPYLRSVHDAYCTKQLNAYWQREIPLKDWMAAMRSYGANTSDTACLTNLTTTYRQSGFTCGGKTIYFKNLRAYFKLKSAYFNVVLVNPTTVMLQGRGFGHGVGLCQEGAMQMAKQGKSYKEILKHYFTGIHIVNPSDLNEFSEK
jgi:stage II sporulation protein D